MRTLKIAFAMGGGVSLGTFSGAALTECIKQLIIQGGTRDEAGNWVPFDEVELDVFSGASAGAISLSIMVRMLIAYRDKIGMLEELPRYQKLIKRARIKGDERADGILIEEAIRHGFGPAVRANELSERQLNQLVGIQVAQDFEELLWCHLVDVERLAGMGKPFKTMQDTGSILDQDYLKDLAAKAVIPDDSGFGEYHEDTVLASRVLIVNSLTRLEPIKIEGRATDMKKKAIFVSDKSQSLYQKLIDTVLEQGMSSETHKDLRVFDLNLKPRTQKINVESNFPERWVFADKQAGKAAPKAPENRIVTDQSKPLFDLSGKDIWVDISSTCLAAGAFPIAFESVVLNRYNFETGEAADRKYRYIDGGTLNNEPIREAFRLSGFLDDLDERSPDNYKRVIIYVDPFIEGGQTKIITEQPLPQPKTASKPEIQLDGATKIKASLSPLISVLRREGSIVEMDKAAGIYNKFRGREMLMDFYSKTVDNGLKSDIQDADARKAIFNEMNSTIGFVSTRLSNLQHRITIPASMLQFKGEIIRAIIEPQNAKYFQDKVFKAEVIRDRLQSGELLKDYNAFFLAKTVDELFTAIYFNYWLKAMFFVGINVTMDLSGKDEDRTIIPIGPVEIRNGEIEPIPLAGMPLEGFLGFFDLGMRLHDFEVGKVVANNILSGLDLLKTDISMPVPSILDSPIPQEKITDTMVRLARKRLISDNLLKYFFKAPPQKMAWLYSLAARLIVSVFFSEKKLAAFVQSLGKETVVTTTDNKSMDEEIMDRSLK